MNRSEWLYFVSDSSVRKEYLKMQGIDVSRNPYDTFHAGESFHIRMQTVGQHSDKEIGSGGLVSHLIIDLNILISSPPP